MSFFCAKKVIALPYRAKKPCAYPGCPKLTNSRYCPEHERAEAQRYERYDRDPNTAKNYGSSWRRVRDRFLEAHPLCEICQKDGKLVPAVLVHHKIKITDGGANDDSNLAALCQFHHSQLHGKQGDRWG